MDSSITLQLLVFATCLTPTGAVELRNSLQLKFGLELSATVAFDYPTIAALAENIVNSLPISQRPASHSDSLHEFKEAEYCCPPSDNGAIIIVGVAGIIPGSQNLSHIPDDSASGEY